MFLFCETFRKIDSKEWIVQTFFDTSVGIMKPTCHFEAVLCEYRKKFCGKDMCLAVNLLLI